MMPDLDQQRDIDAEGQRAAIYHARKRDNPGSKIGAENRERVRSWLAAHIGGTNRECGEALGLSEMAVGRHVRAIRSEWVSDDAPCPECGNEERGQGGYLTCQCPAT